VNPHWPNSHNDPPQKYIIRVQVMRIDETDTPLNIKYDRTTDYCSTDLQAMRALLKDLTSHADHDINYFLKGQKRP
jgi:hypothetical protein